MTGVVVSEAAFMRQVTDMAQLFGWQYVHFRPARTAHGWRTPVAGPLGPGWPDLVLVRGERLVFAELKSQRAKPTILQVEVLERLRDTGAETYVWRPADFDAIAMVLK